MVITEAELREWWQNGRGEIPTLPADTRFSPAAADFLRDHQLKPHLMNQTGPVLFNPQHPVSLHPPGALCCGGSWVETEKPYAVKTILTEIDVETWPARGIQRFEMDESTVLTDQALEKAMDLGIRVVRKKSEPPTSASPISHNPAVYPQKSPLKPEQDVPVSKKFYTDVDIETLHQNGSTCLEVGDDVVLTDLAREKAARLGLTLVKKAPAPVSQQTANPSENDLFVQVKAAVMGQLRGPVDESIVDAVIRKVLAGVKGL